MSSRLSGAERKYLRGLAHGYKPVVQVGKGGLSESLLRAIDEALEAHELIKLRFLGARDEKREVAAELEKRLGGEMVGIIGHVGIYFRPHPDPEKRRIRPSRSS